jgi:hypothetical protein
MKTKDLSSEYEYRLCRHNGFRTQWYESTIDSQPDVWHTYTMMNNTNRWAKLPEPHQALINYAASVMRAKFPEKTEDELYRAEGVIATLVKSRRRKDKRYWTLNVKELELQLKRVEVLS